MANTYTWDCKTVDVKTTVGNFSNVVYNVHWRMTAVSDTETPYQAVNIGTQALTIENIQPDGFIPVEELTHAQIISWVEEAMGEDRIAQIKQYLDTLIQEKINPTKQTITIQN